MKNFLQNGDALNVVAPAGGVVSGQPLIIGKIFGVCGSTRLVGETFALWRKGIFSLPKTNAQAWNQGDSLYWDAANAVVTNVNSGALLPVGYAADVATNPSSIGPVVLAQAAS
ncbi:MULTISPECIES: DUF2190 family protein [unclassified Methylobacterium]|uniref:DUF2190 family protein n=1 Tax=unclassified Methylobacterium TaxID=2615210 RepID=UPI00226A3017|nr:MULTISPECIES: DUF2190 family protein [unclassified Methylobacterium]